MGILIFFSRYI